MQANISLKRAIQSMIFFLMVVAIALIWPLKIIRPWQSVGETDPYSDNIVQNEGTIMQEFVPEMYGLSYISFYVYNEEQEDLEDAYLVYRLFDEQMKKLQEKTIWLKDLSLPGECRIRMGSNLQVGATYYFTIENVGAELLISMKDGINPDVRYDYKTLFTRTEYAFFALAALLAGGFFIGLTELLLRKDSRLVKYDLGFRMTVGILAVAISLLGAWNVFPGKKFTDNAADILFYEIGIALFLVFTLYGLFHKRETIAAGKLIWKDVAAKIPSFLQSVAFAGVMLGGVRYLNALKSYDQKMGANIVLACFAVAVIARFSKKEIINWYNILYLVPSVCYGIYYCQQYRDNLEEYNVYKGIVIYSILWGIVAINTIRLLIRNKRNSRVSRVYLIALVLLVAEMVRSRNERAWPIDIAIFWGIFALQVIYRGKVQQYLNSFSNGVFIHFIGLCIYTVLYRPFHYYMYTRYPGKFHTVTMAAVYLALVFVLALIRFMEIYREKGSLKASWKELGIVGVSAAFLFLTLSRAGLLAAVALGVLVLVLTAFMEYRDGVKGFAVRTGILVTTCACFFFIVFTACRIVPAVVGKPFVYDIEWFPDSITPGEEWNSPRFITLSRFFGVADNKLNQGVGEAIEKEVDVTTDPTKVAMDLDSEKTDSAADLESRQEKLDAYSNGRLQIYKLYLSELNWTGHKSVSIMAPNGKETGHAHNVFLQVAFDFGIGEGLLFILFCIFAGIRSIFYYLQHKSERSALVPSGVLGVFGICGLVEWVYIPYIPTGFAFYFVLVLLIPAQKKDRGQNEKDV